MLSPQAAGTLAKCGNSYTGAYIAEMFKRNKTPKNGRK